MCCLTNTIIMICYAPISSKIKLNGTCLACSTKNHRNQSLWIIEKAIHFICYKLSIECITVYHFEVATADDQCYLGMSGDVETYHMQ